MSNIIIRFLLECQCDSGHGPATSSDKEKNVFSYLLKHRSAQARNDHMQYTWVCQRRRSQVEMGWLAGLEEL